MNKSSQPLKRKIAAIMAADIAEYSRIIAEDEEEALARLEFYRQVFDEFVRRAGGRVFNAGGDSVMCEFPSAVDATRCAIDIQASLRTRNLAYPPHRQMHFRIGITIGDVVERHGDLLGDGVNIAARLQTLAEPGSICVSRNVQEAVSNKVSVQFRDMGHREVKNLPQAVHAFQIETNGSTLVPASPSRQNSAAGGVQKRFSPALWFALGIAATAVGASLYWLDLKRPETVAALAEPDRQSATQPKPSQSIVVTEGIPPAQAFERLAKSGGIVQDAASAPELYHNARLFEARGESANARRDYLAFAALGTDYIDPLLRMASLIRTQDGRAGAREVFAALANSKSRAAALVYSLQFEEAERARRLTAFADAHPDYAPVHALLAAELSEDRQNTQTIDEKTRELAALQRFLAAENEGKLIPHFLDQSVLAQWLDRAQRRNAALKVYFAEGRNRISAQFTRSNAGWSGVITLPEAATWLEYRLGAGHEFRTTGLSQILDPQTGKPMPKPHFEFASEQGPTDIAVRYLDAKGVPSAVTQIAFDPAVALARSLRDTLERTSGSWLAFGSGQNSQNLYFTHVITYRCAIAKLELGFNGAAPAEAFVLPACDPANPYKAPSSSRFFMNIGADVETVGVRITFVGGDTSEVKTFRRPK